MCLLICNPTLVRKVLRNDSVRSVRRGKGRGHEFGTGGRGAIGDVLVEHVGDHLDLGLCCCDLLCGAGLRAAAAEEEGHVCDLRLMYAIIVLECSVGALSISSG